MKISTAFYPAAVFVLGRMPSEVLPFVLPGPVCGMGLFLAALIFGIVDEDIIDEVCRSLRLRMNLFFAPGADDLIAYYSELRPHLIKLLFVTVASAALGICGMITTLILPLFLRFIF